MRILSTIRHYLCRMFRRKKINLKNLFVDIDPGDNSVTLSRALIKHMRLSELSEAKVFTFQLSDTKEFAFIINPPFLKTQESVYADIQYNTLHRCTGFETLCPTAAKMFYEYRIHELAPHRFNVQPTTLLSHQDKQYYIILRDTAHKI